MEEIVKLTSLSSKSWHYKLVKFTFGIEGKIFKNLCPYFWLVVASLLCCVFVFIVKAFGKFLDNMTYTSSCANYYSLSNRKKIQYEQWLKSITPVQMYDYQYAGCVLKKSKTYKKYSYSVPKEFERKCNIIGDWYQVNNIEGSLYDFKEDYYSLLRELNNEEQLKKMKDHIQREQALSIIKKAKLFVSLLITALTACLAFCITALLILTFTSIINHIYLYPVDTGIGVGVIFAIVSIGVAFYKFVKRMYYLYDIRKTNTIAWYDCIYFYPIYGIIWLFTDLLWKHIILAFCHSVSKAFSIFGGIFAEYFGAAKGDYCPGIRWEDED